MAIFTFKPVLYFLLGTVLTLIFFAQPVTMRVSVAEAVLKEVLMYWCEQTMVSQGLQCRFCPIVEVNQKEGGQCVAPLPSGFEWHESLLLFWGLCK